MASNNNSPQSKQEQKIKRMMTLRRIMAMVGVIVIALLYVWFFVLAVNGNENTQSALFSALAATIIVPVLIYVFGRIAKNMAEFQKDMSDEPDD